MFTDFIRCMNHIVTCFWFTLGITQSYRYFLWTKRIFIAESVSGSVSRRLSARQISARYRRRFWIYRSVGRARERERGEGIEIQVAVFINPRRSRASSAPLVFRKNLDQKQTWNCSEWVHRVHRTRIYPAAKYRCISGSIIIGFRRAPRVAAEWKASRQLSSVSSALAKFAVLFSKTSFRRLSLTTRRACNLVRAISDWDPYHRIRDTRLSTEHKSRSIGR